MTARKSDMTNRSHTRSGLHRTDPEDSAKSSLDRDQEGKTITFQPIRRGYVPEEIAAQIESAILLQTFMSGDRLESERELKNRFQASRGAIREALSILKQKGLITVKRGSGGGAFIVNITVDKAGEGLAMLIRQKLISFNELAEFRECAEGVAAALAAERRTEEGIAELKAVVSQMKSFLDKGETSWDAFYPLELKAHETLISQCKNKIFQLVLTTIHLNIHPYLLHESNDLSCAEMILNKRGPYDAYSDWVEIIEGLENKEASRVGSIVRSHVFRYNRTIRGLKNQKGSKFDLTDFGGADNL